MVVVVVTVMMLVIAAFVMATIIMLLFIPWRQGLSCEQCENGQSRYQSMVFCHRTHIEHAHGQVLRIILIIAVLRYTPGDICHAGVAGECGVMRCMPRCRAIAASIIGRHLTMQRNLNVFQVACVFALISYLFKRCVELFFRCSKVFFVMQKCNIAIRYSAQEGDEGDGINLFSAGNYVRCQAASIIITSHLRPPAPSETCTNREITRHKAAVAARRSSRGRPRG
jgi:hypothetical protein